jgi:hypothetical protein
VWTLEQAKYPELQVARPVARAVERFETETGEKIPNNPSQRLEVYLNRLEKLILDPSAKQLQKRTGDVEGTLRPRAVSVLRKMILDEYVYPNKEQMAMGAARVETRAARQMGIEAEYTDEVLEQRGEIAVGDLESSLDQWINYLTNPNEPYPMWFRYYAFRNVLNLGEYDKDKKEFPKRSKGTFKLFPDLDRGALAYIEETMSAAYDDEVLMRVRKIQKEEFGTPEADMLTPAKAESFAKLPFAKQYAEGVESQGEITPELRAETRGEWVHYSQGQDPKDLWKSLQNKGTAWCTRGYPTAQQQLKGGDFYVYYTLDAAGQPAIPRIAIRMNGQGSIAEPPRGVFDSQQNVEPNMLPILDEKLLEFGQEADSYRKRSSDMKKLTALEQKVAEGELLSREDLIFLYEVDAKIEGFGYRQDPRITELRKYRNIEVDILVIFDCTREQIASVPSDINENTRVYIGQLEPGIFTQFQDVEHIYTSFPDKNIRREKLTVGGKSAQELEAAMKEAGIRTTKRTQSMLQDTEEFIHTETKENLTLMRLSVADLGLRSGANTSKIYQRAEELGLDLCPPDTVPTLGLKYQDQLNEPDNIGPLRLDQTPKTKIDLTL